MKKIVKLLTIFALSNFLFSCNNLPNEEQAKTAISEKINEISNKDVELTEFKKTNAQEQNIFGVEMYTIEFSGKVKYKKSGFIHNYPYKRFDISNKNFLNINDNVESNLIKYYTEVKANDVRQITGNVTFEKKEKGWTANSHFIKLTE